MLNSLLNENTDDSFERSVLRLPGIKTLYPLKRRKTRILVQRGLENILLKLEDIVLFYTENKIVYAVDRFEKKYLTDTHLLELEEELDPLVFFRANRQYIVNINFIKSFKAYEKVKIKVDLHLSVLTHCVVISQETAPRFRKWIHEA